jgi:hypothetical protein
MMPRSLLLGLYHAVFLPEAESLAILVFGLPVTWRSGNAVVRYRGMLPLRLQCLFTGSILRIDGMCVRAT